MITFIMSLGGRIPTNQLTANGELVYINGSPVTANA